MDDWSVSLIYSSVLRDVGYSCYKQTVLLMCSVSPRALRFLFPDSFFLDFLHLGSIFGTLVELNV